MLKIKFTDNEETRRHNNAVSYCFCLCTMGETGHGIMRKNEGCPIIDGTAAKPECSDCFCRPCGLDETHQQLWWPDHAPSRKKITRTGTSGQQALMVTGVHSH